MIALAWDAYPAEAVGLVGGARPGRARSVHPLPNLAPLGAFFAEPYSQYEATRRIEAARERVIATFHSHPEGGASLSAEDRAHLFAVAPTAIVIALQMRGRRVEVAAFRRSTRGAVTAIDLVVQEEPPSR
jgi:proteasome lid subunit RPN8/RPN11